MCRAPRTHVPVRPVGQSVASVAFHGHVGYVSRPVSTTGQGDGDADGDTGPSPTAVACLTGGAPPPPPALIASFIAAAAAAAATAASAELPPLSTLSYRRFPMAGMHAHEATKPYHRAPMCECALGDHPLPMQRAGQAMGVRHGLHLRNRVVVHHKAQGPKQRPRGKRQQEDPAWMRPPLAPPLRCMMRSVNMRPADVNRKFPTSMRSADKRQSLRPYPSRPASVSLRRSDSSPAGELSAAGNFQRPRASSQASKAIMRGPRLRPSGRCRRAARGWCPPRWRPPPSSRAPFARPPWRSAWSR
eukprot:COSAG01_NODE_7137_length_3335_cov_3.540482_2_plen_302_part_00